VKRVAARWERAILVCSKCEKKLDGGFGIEGAERLSRCLARAGGGGKGRKARVGVAGTRCLKLCPKRAVVVVDAGRPGEWLVVPAGTPLAEVTRALGIAGAIEHDDQPSA